MKTIAVLTAVLSVVAVYLLGLLGTMYAQDGYGLHPMICSIGSAFLVLLAGASLVNAWRGS